MNLFFQIRKNEVVEDTAEYQEDNPFVGDVEYDFTIELIYKIRYQIK